MANSTKYPTQHEIECDPASVCERERTPIRSDRTADGSATTGASPSNTAPANYTDVKILRSGIDSLYVAYQGELREDLEPTLEAAKCLAQSSVAAEQKDATVLLSDQPFAVLGKGKGRFAYVLTNNWFHLQVSRARANKLPLAYVQIKNEVLTLAPLDDVVMSLNQVAGVLAKKVVHPSVSRVDLCADFTTECDLDGLPQHHWVTRALSLARYYEGKRFSGYVFGQGGPISCRIYDKTLEVKKSKKTYLFPLWKQQGWDGESPVWRVEFQMKSEVLRECRVRTMGQLMDQMNSLWCYCTTQWLRLCDPSDAINQSRWPVAPLWSAISEVTFNDESTEELRRIRKDTAPCDQSLFINGLGGLTSFMAREGILKIEDAMPRYLEAAYEFHRNYSQHNGKLLTSYVREKVALKRTKYSARQMEEYDFKTRNLKEEV